MTDYIIEDELDFFKELNSNKSYDNIDDCCLISKEKLGSDYLELKCGHKFNQQPLYLEYLEQKKSSRKNMEVIKIYNSVLRCPYCRSLNKSDIFTIEKNKSKGEGDGVIKCNRILKFGKNRGNPCGCKVFQDNLCKRHYNLTEPF